MREGQEAYKKGDDLDSCPHPRGLSGNNWKWGWMKQMGRRVVEGIIRNRGPDSKLLDAPDQCHRFHGWVASAFEDGFRETVEEARAGSVAT
ncbi:MAG: hypothetical protein PHV93_04790 [Candidatus Pacebacteria bacterium]|nr:hypothetical protein [Candidatus Paceibacterota bacterium]